MATNKKPTSADKQLLAFLKRRHPQYVALAAHWEFLYATYEGGRAWFDKHIHRYIKEGVSEFSDRLTRAYRFNHTREVVELTIKYLFKMDASRSEDVPQVLKDFWKRSTLQGQTIREFSRAVATSSSIFGRCWVVVDTNKNPEARTLAHEIAQGARVYAYLVTPLNMLDMSYGDDGQLLWALVHEVVRDDKDPMTATGNLQSRFRLWTRDSSQLFRIEGEGTSQRVTVGSAVTHGLGIVPIVNADNVLSDEKWAATALIADVAYLDRACANYMSNLDAIIQDQTFSQLAMPSQGVTQGAGDSDEQDAYAKLIEMGTKRIFLYDASQSGSAPHFLSPDVKQAQLILQVVNKIINEIYHSTGLAGERTKEDNAQGIDNSSGVAKAYDFERVNGLLAAKADSLESFENRLARVVCLYSDKTLEENPVSYPDSFDVRGLHDEFELAARLALVEAPDGMRRLQMESVVDKLFPKLKGALREKLLSELKSWPPEPVVDAPSTPSGGKAIKAAGTQKLSAKLASD